MDFQEIKSLSLKARRLLIANHIHPEIIIVFGSQVKGTPREDSDLDMAIVSSDFGKDRFEEGVLLNTFLSALDSRIEAIPIGLNEYLDQKNSNPLLAQIKNTGIAIF